MLLLLLGLRRQKLIAFERNIASILPTAKLFKQLGKRNVQGNRDFFNTLNRCILLPAFQLTNIRWMASGKLCQLFLTQALCHSVISNPLT